MVDWTLTYKTTNMLRWGAGIGTLLTETQVDTNFADLEERVWELENDPPAANSISNVDVVDGELYVYLQDATVFGPFTLPTAIIRWRGEFTADTAYFTNDLLVSSNSIYLVLQNHVTGAEFDPDLESSDDPVYYLVWAPLDATFSTILTVGTTTRQIDNTEAGSYYRCVHVDGCEIIVPTNAVAPFRTGDEVHFYQASLNPITFTANPGVTINPYDGYLFETAGRGRVVTMKYIGSNTWDIFGGLAEDIPS